MVELSQWIGLVALIGLGLLLHWKRSQDRTLFARSRAKEYARANIKWYDPTEEVPWLSWTAFDARLEEAGQRHGEEIAAFACHAKHIHCPCGGKRLFVHYMPAYTPFDRERLYLMCLTCSRCVGEILLEKKVESRV